MKASDESKVPGGKTSSLCDEFVFLEKIDRSGWNCAPRLLQVAIYFFFSWAENSMALFITCRFCFRGFGFTRLYMLKRDKPFAAVSTLAPAADCTTGQSLSMSHFEMGTAALTTNKPKRPLVFIYRHLGLLIGILEESQVRFFLAGFCTKSIDRSTQPLIEAATAVPVSVSSQ